MKFGASCRVRVLTTCRGSLSFAALDRLEVSLRGLLEDAFRDLEACINSPGKHRSIGGKSGRTTCFTPLFGIVSGHHVLVM